MCGAAFAPGTARPFISAPTDGGVPPARPDRFERSRTTPLRPISVGRRTIRPLARRQDHRLRHQRGRRLPAPSARHPFGQNQAGDRHAAGVIASRVAPEQPRTSPFQLGFARSPFDVYSLDADQRQSRTLDRKRDGGLDRRANFAEPELVRWKSFDGRDDLAASSTGRRREVPRQAPGHHQHPRRPRRRSPAPASSAATTTTSTSSASRSSSRTSAARPATARRSYARQRLQARGLRQGHRRAARLDRASGRTSTPTASWSPAAATAAT